MITLLFVILMFAVFGKIIGFAFRATWGFTKVFFSIILLPILLIGLVFAGLIYIALPILIVIGLVTLISGTGK